MITNNNQGKYASNGNSNNNGNTNGLNGNLRERYPQGTLKLIAQISSSYLKHHPELRPHYDIILIGTNPSDQEKHRRFEESRSLLEQALKDHKRRYAGSLEHHRTIFHPTISKKRVIKC